MLHCKYCGWYGNEKDVLVEKEDYGRVFECPKCGFYNDVDGTNDGLKDIPGKKYWKQTKDGAVVLKY